MTVSYNGRHYGVNWEWVITILSGCATVLLINTPKAPWTTPLAIVTAAFWVFWFFGVSNRNKEATKPAILYNLTINIHCYKRTFKGTNLDSAEDEIEQYGLAIHRAKKLIGGKWHVVEGGHLVKGFVKDIESCVATVDVDEVIFGLARLQEAVKDPEKNKQQIWQPHIHMESGWPLYVWVDEKGLYVH
jgi:hypothetical protein